MRKCGFKIEAHADRVLNRWSVEPYFASFGKPEHICMGVAKLQNGVVMPTPCSLKRINEENDAYSTSRAADTWQHSLPNSGCQVFAASAALYQCTYYSENTYDILYGAFDSCAGVQAHCGAEGFYYVLSAVHA